MDLSGLSAGVLDRRLRLLLGEERRIQVDFLLHLDEFDRQRGFAVFGATSLWSYLRSELRMLECAIQRRLAALEVIRRAPVAVEYLRDGRLCVTGLALLKEVVTAENSEALLEKASNKSRMEIEYVVACEREPRPDPAPMIRRLPDPIARAVAQSEIEPQDASAVESRDIVGGVAAPCVGTNPETGPSIRAEYSGKPVARFEPVSRIEPLSAERFLVKFAASKEFVSLLEKAKQALRHVEPAGDLEGVITRALRAVVEAHEQKHAPKKVAGWGGNSDELEALTELNVEPVAASPGAIDRALEKYYQVPCPPPA